MRYLDYSRHDQIVRQYFGDDFSERAVGKSRRIDSGYIDIVRFFGSEAVDPSTVSVQYDSRPFVFADPVIAEFASDVERLMCAEGRLYDGPLVTKLITANPAGGLKSISVQPVAYGMQAGSCFALDLPHPLFAKHGGTLRTYWKSKYPSTSIESNPLAICLGVCGFVAVTDTGGKTSLLCQNRSGLLASLESSAGPSVAGSVDWNSSYLTLDELIQSSMNQEIAEELGLDSRDYSIIPLAYAREIFRGEKPQIFCLINASLTRLEIDGRLGALRPDHPEHDSWFWVDLNGDLAPALNHEARMNYYLTEEFPGR